MECIGKIDAGHNFSTPRRRREEREQERRFPRRQRADHFTDPPPRDSTREQCINERLPTRESKHRLGTGQTEVNIPG